MKVLNCLRITKKDREIAESLNYSGINFPVSKKDYDKIGVMKKININFFCYEDKMVFPIYLSDLSFNDKTKCKNKKWFCKSCLQCFSNEKVLIEHNKDCLLING